MSFKVQTGNFVKMGIQKCENQVTFTFYCPKEIDCTILLYHRKNCAQPKRIALGNNYCLGTLRSVTIIGLDVNAYDYCFEFDGEKVRDPYAERVIGREKWNDEKREADAALLSGFIATEYDWEDEVAPSIAPENMIMYKLHVRGFSMADKGKKKGTFLSVMNKIPYLKDMGVTTLELMPVYEFEEKMEDKVNYWGYTKGDYCAVKASYASATEPDVEFKDLVKALHKNQIEVILEMCFPVEERAEYVVDVLRRWVIEYHVDGFKLLGAGLPIGDIARDSLLSGTKIFYEQIPQNLKDEYSNLYLYNEDFLYQSRKMLNHLGGDMPEFLDKMKITMDKYPAVNYIANSNTFTLADVFSYNEKHNMENGENNTDGNNWNFSSNYGVEGPTRKQFVKKIREKQMRNAMAVLYLAQGIPLLWSGDEICNSQNGNNNAYCQDNRTGWVNWRNETIYRQQQNFVRELIAFRKAHPILAKAQQYAMSDYRQLGYPDLSYHGSDAWLRGINGNARSIGMMYYEAYADDKTIEENVALVHNGEPAKAEFIYIGYNFYMGLQVFALPKLPKNMKWYKIMDTGEVQPFLEEPVELTKNNYEAFGQTVSILIGR